MDNFFVSVDNFEKIVDKFLVVDKSVDNFKGFGNLWIRLWISKKQSVDK